MPGIEINVEDYQNVISTSVGGYPLIQVAISHPDNTVSVTIQKPQPFINVDVIATGPQGIQGPPGADGVNGVDGRDGVDGKDGKDGVDGKDGQDGQDGQDGVSPVITSEAITGGHRLTIVDAGGTTTVDVLDGADGKDGKDGADGKDGEDGAPGPAGPGVPTGGAAGEVLRKKTGTDYDTEWGADTDTKVTQTATTTSGYTYWRPLLVGQSSVSSESTGFSTTTDGVRAFDNIRVQPSTGTVKATTFKGNLTGNVTGNVTGDVTGTASGNYSASNPPPYPVTSVNGSTGAVTLSIPSTASDVGALPDTTTYAASPAVGGSATVANGIHYAQVDGTSTSTKFTATIPGITSYYDGLTIWLKNGIVTSASGFTVNINSLGAKKCYNNMTAATQDTTIFNINYTMLFVYDSSLDSGSGGYYIYRGYDANTNTVGYQVRTNSFSLPMTSIVYRYRLLFQSADKKRWVPANNSTSTNATAARTPCQDPINPLGPIVYYGTTASVAAGSRPSAANLWQEYTLNLGYSFQASPNYVLTEWKPVYLVCAPQSDGSAIIDSTTPFTQDLPSTEDNKLYILLGFAYSTTSMELVYYHPVYWYKGGRIRHYTDEAPELPAVTSVDNGKFLVVDNGAWTAQSMSVWNGGSY